MLILYVQTYFKFINVHAEKCVGEGTSLFKTNVRHYFNHVRRHLFKLLCRLWCTWLLHHVVNEVVHPIIGDVPKACHI